ncbi:hypothetical protein ACND7Z_003792 [Escherichia coli]
MNEQPNDFNLYSLVKQRIDNDLPVYVAGVTPPALDAVMRRVEAETGKSAKVVRVRQCRFCRAMLRDDNEDFYTHCCISAAKKQH